MDLERLRRTLAEKKTETLDLGEFNEKLAGQSAEVWVNPPRKLVLEMERWAKDHKDESTPMFVGVLLGITAEETALLFEGDVAFVNWLANRVLEMYREYAKLKKTNAND